MRIHQEVGSWIIVAVERSKVSDRSSIPLVEFFPFFSKVFCGDK